jgi:hypothetical protein
VLDPETGGSVDGDTDGTGATPTGIGRLYVGAPTPEIRDGLTDAAVAALPGFE